MRSEIFSLLRLLVSRLRRPYLVIAVVAIASLASLGCTVASPMLMGQMVDALTLNQRSQFVVLLGCFIVVLCVQIGASTGAGYFCSVQEESLGRRLREDVASALLDRNPKGPINVGDATTRIVADTQQLKNGFSALVVQPSVDLLSLLFVTVLMVRASALVAFLTVLSAPCSVLTNRALAKHLEQNAARGRAAASGLMQLLQSWLTRSPWVILFGIKSVADERVKRQSGELFSVAKRGIGLRTRIGLVSTVVTTLPHILIFAIVGSAVLNGERTVGSLVTLMGLTAMIAAPLNRLVAVFSAVVPGLLPSFRRVNEPLKEWQPATSSARDGATSEVVEAVEVRDLTVRHGESGPTLSVPELQARRGEVVCITGRNGSGKSTFALSLVGMMVRSGEVKLHTSSAQRDLAPQDVSFAPADPVVFDGSLEDNVLLFAAPSEATRALVDWARGSSSQESASDRSRGELQRQTVARAFCLKRPVLVLDEPTIGLDVQSVEELIEWVKLARARGPVMIVTHDSRLLALADRQYEAVRTDSRWDLLHRSAPAIADEQPVLAQEAV